MKRNDFCTVAGKFGLVWLVFFCLNCGKGSSDTPLPPAPPPPPPPPPGCTTCALLYYGGDQQGAPTLSSGEFKVAARYTASKIGILAGKTIKEVHYFVGSKPDSIKVNFYGPKDESTPGDLLYSVDVTAATVTNKWNVHILTQSLILKSEDIWLSIEFKQSVAKQTIGCDPGPAIEGGDWIYSSSEKLWLTYRERNGEDINWNIRLNVAL